MHLKIDPIRGKYFAPLERAEKWFRWLFYLTAVVSVAVLLIDKQTHEPIYGALQIAFAILTVTTSVLAIGIRLYWAPRAHKRRMADYLSRAFAVDLTAERTQWYYNNSATEPARRLILQLLENCFFTKEIALLMCRRSRIVFTIYCCVWFVAVLFRGTPVDIAVVLCQVVFGEAVISACLRLEWLRNAAERIYDDVFRQLNSASGNTPFLLANAIDELVEYECHKAIAGVTLSSNLFDENNGRLSKQWEGVLLTLEGS